MNAAAAWLASSLDWMIGGALMMVVSTFSSYRLLTRSFGWGPSDT